MARIISYRIIAKDKFSSVASQVNRGAKRLKTTLKQISREALNVQKNWKKMGSTMKSVGMKLSIMSAGIVAVATAAIVAAGRNESLAASYEVLAGSAEKGKKLIRDLYTFAAKTPFEIKDLGEAGQMLMAMGQAPDKLIEKLRMLGEMAAANNRSIKEFALPYGQMSAIGFLTGQDAMQFEGKGIAIRQMIARKFGVKIKDIYALIERKMIPSSVVEDLLVELTTSGRLAGMMQKISGTMPGLWSNTQDLLYQSSIEVGNIITKQLQLKEILLSINDSLESFLGNVKQIASENPRLTKVLLFFTGLLIVLGPITMAMGIMVAGWAAFTAIAGTLGIAVGTLALTFGGIALAIGLVTTALAALYVNWEKVSDAILWKWTLLKQIPGISSISKFFEGRALETIELAGSINSSNKSETDINVNLNGPKGSVSSMDYNSTGPANVTTGLNMVGMA